MFRSAVAVQRANLGSITFWLAVFALSLAPRLKQAFNHGKYLSLRPAAVSDEVGRPGFATLWEESYASKF